LLGLTARALAGAALPAQSSKDPPLIRRFETLLEAHFAEHWKVSDYARELAVTPTHLTRIARTAIGEAVSRLIDARVMREARRNRIHLMSI
jgi:AraC family transcriptional activator of pobA